ncbi:MAG TPA: glycosyltransferase family 2 protein [Coleofasciculaceae cyanobacterium]
MYKKIQFLVQKINFYKQNPSLFLELYLRPLILQTRVKHIYGKQRITYSRDEIIVLCVVRNGELYIKSFIEHYLSLGVKHIVFLDNGSTDETIDIAKTYKNVTILQTQCPYKKYETVMKRYLIKRFSKNKWNLFADIDELFDYPFSNILSLRLFIDYLNSKSYTAVVVQMLDLFSDTPLAELKSCKNDSLKKNYNYYDISNIKKEIYPERFGGRLENIELYWDGIRKSLFGSNNYLSKAALMLFNQKISDTFVDCHHIRKADVADVTCVFLHYPFTSLFYQKVAEAVKTNRYAVSASQDYQMYWRRLQQDPNLNIKQASACSLKSINELVDKGFLVVSDDYRQWVKNHQKSE